MQGLRCILISLSHNSPRIGCMANRAFPLGNFFIRSSVSNRDPGEPGGGPEFDLGTRWIQFLPIL